MKSITELRRIAEASTKVVQWDAHGKYQHPHPEYATVRGPYNRWLLVTPVAEQYQKHVADQYADAEFAAAAMNALPELLEDWERMQKALEKIEALTPLNERERREISRDALAALKFKKV